MKDHYTTVRAKFTRWLTCLAVLTVLWTMSATAQISVTVDVPGNTTPALQATYASFALAVTDLNAITAMSGPVVLTCSGSETAPVTGFAIGSAGLNTVLNAAGSNMITITGAATINAGAGGTATPTTAAMNGMLVLNGIDRLTIDGLTFTDGNVANPATMEFGIGMFMFSTSDGCKNNTIKNCSINMQRINNAASTAPVVEGSVGIASYNRTSTATTSLTPASAAGTNSNNKFYSNSITGGNYGIALIGFAATVGRGPAPDGSTFLGDLGNDIGGVALSTGNSILNFGGGAATSPSAGIRANFQWSINIQYNTVNNNNGSGVNHTTTFRGIYAQAGISANATISNNIITIQSGATSSTVSAIENVIGSTSLANTININSNTIRVAYATATSGVMNGILNSSTATTVNINSNNIQGVPSTVLAGTGTHIGISGGSTGGTLNIGSNTISNLSLSGASGIFRGIIASTPPTTWSVTGNTIENISYVTVGSSGSIDGIYNFASAQSMDISNNIIRNLSTPTAGTLQGIYIFTSSGTLKTCNNNQVYNFSTTAGGAGGASMNGIRWSVAPLSLSNNIIYALNSTGTTGGTGGAINGLLLSGTGNIDVTRNAIYDLSSTSTNPTITGITVSAGAINGINNNLIGDLRATASTGNISISGMLISGGTTNNIFHNTVNLASSTTSATTFGTSAIYFSSGTPTNNLRNNIFVNTSTPGPTGGFSAAIRYTTAPTAGNFPAGNNNNFYYAGTPAANQVIYCEGSTATPSNGQQTIADYKTYINTTLPVAGRESSSVSEVPNWLSTSGSNPIVNFLKYDASIGTQIEQGGATGTGVTTDYSGTTVRCPGGGCPGGAGSPDMGAWELAGITPAPSIALNSVTPGITSQCATTARLVSVTITTAVGTVTGATLQGNNGAAFGPIVMTNTSGNIWEASIPVASPANATVTWSVIATNSVPLTATYNGASYADEPLFGVTGSISASANPICSGSPSILTAVLSKLGTATVGTGTSLTGATTQPTAFCNRWPSYRMQLVYTAAELSSAGLSAGNFTAMAFDITSLGDGATNSSFRVKIGNTALSTLSGAFVDTTTGFTTVFPSQTYTHTASGLQTINFSTPFYWDGTSNIIVQVVHNGADITNNSITYYTATAGNTVAYTATAATNAASFSTNRLNTTFTGTTSPAISSVTWNDGVSNFSVTNPTSVNAAVPTTYTAAIVAAGCTFTPSPSLLLGIAAPPTDPTANNTAAQCPGVPTSSVTSTSGLGTPTFKWYDAPTAGTMLQQSTSTTYTTAITTSTTFYVSEIDLGTGCESGRVAVVCTVHTLSATSDVPSFCSTGGSQTTGLHAISSNGSFSFTWSALSAGTVSPSTGPNVTATLSETSDYLVTAVDGGCTMLAYVSLGVYDFPAISLTSNGPICDGSTISLNSGLSAGNFSTDSTITVNYKTPPGGTVVLASAGIANVTQASGTLDDGGWGAIPIGFGYNFFGTQYTTLNVGTNGNVMFGAYNGTALGDFSFTTLPSPLEPLNMIAVLALDNDLRSSESQVLTPSGVHGTVRYWTEGYSPNRRFVLQYDDVREFGDTKISKSQLILFETTGIIECHVISSTNTDRIKMVGVNNGDGTVGVRALAKTGAISVAKAYRFSPPSNYTTTWTGTNLVAPITGTNLFTINTTAMSPGLYPYTFVGTDQITGCTNSTSPAGLSVSVLAAPVTPIASGLTICGAASVTLTVTNAGAIAPDAINWYDAPTGGTLLFTGASYITPVLSSNSAFYVESNNGTCANLGGRVLVSVTVLTPPAITPSGPVAPVCPGDPIVLGVTSPNDPDYTYVWNPGNLTGATQNIAAPASSTTYSVTATDNTAGPNAGCTISANFMVDVHVITPVNAGTDQTKNVGTSANLTATYSTAPTCLKITEITLFSTGLGQTPTYPSYAIGDDMLEITNTGTLPVSLGGVHLLNEGARTMDYIFPAATIPAGGVVVVNFGTGTDDIPNLAFFTGGQTGSTSDTWSSGTNNGIWLTTSSGTIIDAVATNGHTFSGGSGVTALDWNGPGASGIGGDAGTRLTGADLNDATNWLTAGSSTQNIGTINAGLSSCTSPTYSVTWTGGNIVGSMLGDAITTPIFATPQVWTFTASLTDGVCTVTDNVDVTSITPTAPVANFSVNSVNQTVGGVTSTAIFTDLTANVPDNWLWTITGPGAVNYVNGTSAISQNPQVQFTVPGVYDVDLYVDNFSGADNKTEIAYITVTPEYCKPVFTFGGDGCSDGDQVNGFSISDGITTFLDNPNTGCNGNPDGYINYSPVNGITTCDLVQGRNYVVTCTNSPNTWSEGYAVWLDINGDGDFADVGEFVGSAAPAITSNFNITIPLTGVVLGPARMRVIAKFNTTMVAGDYCTTGSFGETEDYTVNLVEITNPPSCPSAVQIGNVGCITATRLRWSASTGFPQGYNVYVGTDGGGVTTPMSLVGGQDIGNDSAFTLPTLTPGTLYYYQVSSYNEAGESLGCAIGSFTSGGSTAQTPTQAPSSYTETMDNAVVPPALPCGVTSSNENFPVDAFTWYTAAGASNAHAGTRYLRIDKNTDNTTAKDDWFYSAPMNLTAGKLYRIYFWHRVGTAGSESFEAFLSNSADAATMLTTSAVFNGSSNLLTYKLDSSADILPLTSGVYYYGFHANGAANGVSLYMDDIQVKQIPVAAMDPASCITIPSMYDQLLVQPVYGAQDYKFKIENLASSFSYEYTRNLAIPDFRLKWAPGVVYDLSYDVSVSYKKNNVWSPYGASCVVTMGPFPTTQLRAPSCNSTITDQYTQLHYDSVSGANDYEIKIVQNTLAYDHTWIRGGSQLDYRMYWAYQSSPTLVDRVPFGFTYDVQVRALVGRTGPAQGNLPGVLGTFGPVCTVTLSGTPQTQLQPASCGVTLANITDQIFCIPVTGASDYQYEIVNVGIGFNATVNRNSSATDFRMNWIPPSSGGVRYATTYDVRVRAKVGGVFLNYGPMCQVTTPVQPLTQLQAPYCPYTLPTFSTTVFSNSILGATNYRYRITDVATSGATYTKIVDRNSPGNDFKFSWTLVCCGGLNMLPNTAYNVEVASYAGGVWSAYGTPCVVTTGASVPRYSPFVAEDGFTASSASMNMNVYPNPAAVAQEYSIEIDGIQAANETIQLDIYNMLGEKVYRTEIVTKEESRMIIKPEHILAPGVYMVEARINGLSNRVKFVVK